MIILKKKIKKKQIKKRKKYNPKMGEMISFYLKVAQIKLALNMLQHTVHQGDT